MLSPPTHHDAELVLRLYDLRREPVMRENRARLLRELWPKTATDMVDVLKSDHQLNVAYRQVTTYWEMAYALCRHGTLNPDLLLASSEEGMFLFARLEPYVAEIRAAGNPRQLRATEWMATQTDAGRTSMEYQRPRAKKLLAARG